MRLRTRKLASVLAVASTFMAATAGAQQAAGDAANTTAPATGAPTAQPASRNSDQLQTVMVTANKRKEDSSKVATSISVISGDDLVAQHIGDFADMTRSIPNISFSGGGGGGDAGNGPGLSNIEMRGVSSTGGSATVGVYLDDVSMTVANLYSMGSAEPKFFDLDRVEVLRGPQGTLYGASSMGGTVKFISNQPNLKAQEGSVYTEVSGSKGGGTSYTGNAVFNQPIIPGELALRVGIQGGHHAVGVLPEGAHRRHRRRLHADANRPAAAHQPDQQNRARTGQRQAAGAQPDRQLRHRLRRPDLDHQLLPA